MSRIAAIFTVAVCLITLRSWGDQAESTAVLQPKVAHYSYDAIPKDPLASMGFSAMIPGTGQIYNKEYLHGILTGIGFWGGLFTAEYMMSRWTRLNTDTVYFQEYDKYGEPTGLNRAVYILRDPDKQVGLPTGEKVVLISAVVVGAASYVFGLYDSYRGAQRYNTKLFADAPVKPEFYCDLGPKRNEVGLRLKF
jgi:TM2 domain-containing membrane protein YozV